MSIKAHYSNLIFQDITLQIPFPHESVIFFSGIYPENPARIAKEILRLLPLVIGAGIPPEIQTKKKSV